MCFNYVFLCGVLLPVCFISVVHLSYAISYGLLFVVFIRMYVYVMLLDCLFPSRISALASPREAQIIA